MNSYRETKEQTLALLRHVVAQAGQHDAALTPPTFAVLYEHLAGINPRLSSAFERACQATPRLDDATMRELHRQFVAEAGAEDAERIRGSMQRLMSSFAESAARTGQEAGLFGQQLGGLNGALAAGDLQGLQARMNEALLGTQAMQDAVATLQARVGDSQREIEGLRAELLRSREEASLCPMTRVLNRRGFEQRLSSMLHERPPRGTSHCLILVDIDHFKRVNDTHGHLVGDRVIAGLGEVLRSVPAEPGMACARFGGEEFAILLPASSLPRAAQVAETVRARARAMRLRNRSTQEVLVQVTVSAGVAAWQPGEDADAFVACADAALYRAKENGRDRVTVA